MDTIPTPPLPSPLQRIAVIGAGPAGRQFAAACLRAGLHVTLEDVMPANLRRAELDLANLTDLLDLALTVEDAVRNADLAIDFVPDELESKLEIFSMVDRMAPPRTLLCTPTDALSITDLASCVYRPELCFALRGLPLHERAEPGAAVDLLYPPEAAPAALATMQNFLARLGLRGTALPDPNAPALVKNQL